jgi:putative DNA primase/helicase
MGGDRPCVRAVLHLPRLFIKAPEKGCGKTTLLDVIGRLVSRPLIASNISAAALFRTIEACNPTILLDEADSFLRHNEDLRVSSTLATSAKAQ